MTNLPTLNASEETIGIGNDGLTVRFLLTGDDTNGSMSVFEVLVPASLKIPAPAHKNDTYEEVLYGIEGVVTWTIDGKAYEVGPGQSVCIPRGAVHHFENFGGKDAKQLVIISPAVLGPGLFRDSRDALNAAAKTGARPDVAKMAEIFRRNGMTIAAPPQH